MPKRSVTMSRNGGLVTMTEMSGHDAETGGHVAPKYPAVLLFYRNWKIPIGLQSFYISLCLYIQFLLKMKPMIAISGNESTFPKIAMSSH